MLTPNELRIGNYVEVENYKIIKLENIHQKGTTIKDEQYLMCMLKPIPLTEYILSNCKSDESRSFYKRFGEIEISIVDDDFVKNIYTLRLRNFYIKIHYLHELQNWCFLANKKELEVNI